MKQTYEVIGHVTVSAYTYVEAESPEEAIRLVRAREVGLCPHGHAQDGVDPWDLAAVENSDGEFRPECATVTTNAPEREEYDDDE